MKLRNPSFCHPWFLRSLGRWKSAGLCAVLPLALVVSCKDSSKPVALQEAPQPAAPKAEAPDANSPSAAKPAAALQAGAEKISFSSQVRPILSNNCFACHGPDSKTSPAPSASIPRSIRAPISPRRAKLPATASFPENPRKAFYCSVSSQKTRTRPCPRPTRKSRR